MVPPGALTFAAASALDTSSSVTPSASSRAGSTATWISRSRPPVTATCATPSICSSRRRNTDSASSFNARRSCCPASEIAMIGSLRGSVRSTTGLSAPSGMPLLSSVWSRSRTFSTAKSMSVPQTNRTVTSDTPSRLTLSTSCTPGTRATCCSTGSVTNRSTSAGPTPVYRV
jgi:hypothetical protein